MILKKSSMADFAKRVRETDRQIIIYGAGVLGQTAAPYWLSKYQLADAVRCYVDADSYKQGTMIPLGSRLVSVESLDILEELGRSCTLLITASAFEPIIRALEQIASLEAAETYFLPVMLLDIANMPKKGGVIKTSETPLIPKKIHYCWFSGSPIPSPLQHCIDSWKEVCPDYEIIRWDESNYDISRNKYMEQAYAHRRWGYIPDYARLDILYHSGGIYLDTDVELLRNLDELLYQPAFCSTEKWGIVNMGISGAQPGNPALLAMLKYREKISFLYPDGAENLMSSGAYDTLPLVNLGLQINTETQLLADRTMTIYAPEFFQPFDYISGETRVTDNTFSIHHFKGTWLEAGAAKERENTREHYRQFLNILKV